MVETDRVVAGAHDRLDHGSDLALGRNVRRVADIDAIEALRYARQVLELEVPAPRDDAPMPTSRGFGLSHGREVERRPLLHPRRHLNWNPSRQIGDHDRTPRLRVEVARADEIEGDRECHAALVERLPRHGQREREVLASPCAVALKLHASWRGKAKHDCPALDRHQRNLLRVTREEAHSLPVSRKRHRPAVNGQRAPVRIVERGFHRQRVQLRVRRRRERVVGVHAAVDRPQLQRNVASTIGWLSSGLSLKR